MSSCVGLTKTGEKCQKKTTQKYCTTHVKQDLTPAVLAPAAPAQAYKMPVVLFHYMKHDFYILYTCHLPGFTAQVFQFFQSTGTSNAGYALFARTLLPSFGLGRNMVKGKAHPWIVKADDKYSDLSKRWPELTTLVGHLKLSLNPQNERGKNAEAHKYALNFLNYFPSLESLKLSAWASNLFQLEDFWKRVPAFQKLVLNWGANKIDYAVDVQHLNMLNAKKEAEIIQPPYEIPAFGSAPGVENIVDFGNTHLIPRAEGFQC